ncbi:MAG TPA: M28 family metallopeptidase [Vicinamibacterales bacterium]|nr:M28 family metallopeptidase [Vicinamibacterales bacterium]
MTCSSVVRLCAAGAAMVLAAQAMRAVEPAPLLGFTVGRADAQRAREAAFDAAIRADEMQTWMKRLAARPHHVGSPYDRENAQFLASLLTSWGYESTIETFDVLFPTPTVRVLEEIAPEHVTATLAEPTLKEDATSGQTSEQLPVYNAYSADGDVTAEIVYVNYGVPADYDVLAQHGIDVKGKIVLARYGGSWRGIKPKVAAEHGAIGCLIYSDPRDDGYFNGDVYPQGPWRSENGAQRGSVSDMPVFPGDPLTPGVGATKDAVRLSRDAAPTLMKIPVLPISWHDAQPLLRALSGPVVPVDWRGALPLTYHFGPGPTTVHLKLAFDWSLKPAYDVIARLPGAERPDEWIIRGNHHDAWVNGAADPVSGAVALLGEARGVGDLVKAGWRPKRTIVYALWDAEEPGLLGSTEWVETHAADLQRHVVAYVNSDMNGRGFLSVGGSHSLETLAGEVARDVIDPETGVSVLERARARRITQGTPEQLREIRGRADLSINALGSGSDYTPFLQHLGIASLDIGFDGESGGGSYHSIFDSIDAYMRFVDPELRYGIALAKVGGRLVLRLADADVLPFRFGPLSDTVSRYAAEVSALADTTRAETTELNRRLADGTLKLTADPRETYMPPSPRDPVPYLNLAPLRNALTRLSGVAARYDRALQAALASDGGVPAAAQPALDAALIDSERALVSDDGLPRRPWFKHVLYAPGLYTGYGVKTLPGVREAIEQRRWTEAEQQAVTTAAAIDRLSMQVQRATELLAPPATRR